MIASQRSPAPARAALAAALIGLGALGAAAEPKPAVNSCPAADAPAHRKLALETCASAQGWLSDVPGGKVSVRKGPFEDEAFRCVRQGCTVTLTGLFSALGDRPTPESAVREKLQAAGWTQTAVHDADGPDGTRFSLHRPGVLCLVSGDWNHWDDEDGGHIEDPYEIRVACGLAPERLPRFEDLPR